MATLTQASSYSGKRDATLALEHDQRAQALASYACGVIALQQDDKALGIAELQRAIRIWSAIGYRLRAAEAENVLEHLPGHFAPTPNLDSVRREAPNSWLIAVGRIQAPHSSQLDRKSITTGRLKAYALRDSLGPAERKVLDYICAGLTSKEIALRVGRSVSTIRNQTIRIFRTFGVNGRGALIEAFADQDAPAKGAAEPQGDLVDDTAANDVDSENQRVKKVAKKSRGMKNYR